MIHGQRPRGGHTAANEEPSLSTPITASPTTLIQPRPSFVATMAASSSRRWSVGQIRHCHMLAAAVDGADRWPSTACAAAPLSAPRREARREGHLTVRTMRSYGCERTRSAHRPPSGWTKETASQGRSAPLFVGGWLAGRRTWPRVPLQLRREKVAVEASGEEQYCTGEFMLSVSQFGNSFNHPTPIKARIPPTAPKIDRPSMTTIQSRPHARRRSGPMRSSTTVAPPRNAAILPMRPHQRIRSTTSPSSGPRRPAGRRTTAPGVEVADGAVHRRSALAPEASGDQRAALTSHRPGGDPGSLPVTGQRPASNGDRLVTRPPLGCENRRPLVPNQREKGVVSGAEAAAG
jgi:hypothetical protein